MKKCSKCNNIYPISSIHFFKNKSSDNFCNKCKNCCKKYNKERYQKNREKELERSRQKYQKNREKEIEKATHRHLKRVFGITIEEYNQMLDDQNKVCKICGGKEIRKLKNGKITRLHVDHNHETGEIRGLLCNRCNIMLGQARDNSLILIKAVKYLRDNNV